MKKFLVMPLSLLLLAACASQETTEEPNESDAPTQETPAPDEPEENAEEPGDAKEDPPENAFEPVDSPAEIASGLNVPWSINKVGNEFYISERSGTVAYVDADGKVTRQEVEFSDPLANVPEAGFLGFVLKEDFAESKEAYGYYVYEQNGEPLNKIAEFALEGNVWQETNVLLDDIQTGSVHHGGRLELDSDGTLFATVGDASQPELAQDSDSNNGKILRLGDNNEFSVYSYGHRNPQGIAWRDSEMYAAEHGQSANDEINRIEEGHNYGWPIIEGNQTGEGMETPFVTTGSNETWAPSGIAIKGNSLYVAALRGTALKVIDLNTGELQDSFDDFGRVRDVLVDGDNVFFISNNTDGRGNPSDDDDKLYYMTAP
ncbi:PQQ-dependent sugar dehydrogenase [Planococcus sp. YIM B11945]|uniref:PQQ-dependent sugar dehydrogenase n=1 Tax=Planococcus sp. YIM B11945 TaxID=3435410 RepID=UPI003D7EF826